MKRSARVLWCLVVLAIAPLVAQARDLPDFRDIVAAATPAVVKVIVEQKEGMRAHPDMDEEQIPEFLRRYFQMPSPPRGRQRMSTGSGFIISDDGYIVTNHHVVEDADSVIVRMPDRAEYDAEVVGLDPRSDLASAEDRCAGAAVPEPRC
jgi:serine protease Do